jgi:hypothetical protein
MAYDENGRALRETVIHDPVVSNMIFRETLRKERNFVIREEFTLTPKVIFRLRSRNQSTCSDIHNLSQVMNTIPPKPNLVVAGEMPVNVAKKVI